MVSVEIITIGSELLDGRIQDKNSSWLGQFLKKKGLKLTAITLIPDESHLIQKTLKMATKRSQIVFISGGLGPTEDDKTKSELAHYFSKQIRFQQKAADTAKKNYERRNKPFDALKNNYSLMPDDFDIHENPCGLAPGLSYSADNLFICASPGVPIEFERMVSEVYFPLIEEKFQWKKNLSQICLKTYGVPEEKIFFDLCPTLFSDLEKFGQVSSLPQFPGVDIWVTSETLNQENLAAEIENYLADSKIKPYIWQIGTLNLQQWLVKNLGSKNLTLATAESCTGGAIASSLTDISGSSKVFTGSVIAYDNKVKVNQLGVSSELLKKYGAVSEQVVAQMATGAKNLIGTDYAISTSGIAGPTGGSEQKPVGTVLIGVATPKEVKTFKYQFRGNRKELKQRFTSMTLLKLVEELLKNG